MQISWYEIKIKCDTWCKKYYSYSMDHTSVEMQNSKSGFTAFSQNCWYTRLNFSAWFIITYRNVINYLKYQYDELKN